MGYLPYGVWVHAALVILASVCKLINNVADVWIGYILIYYMVSNQHPKPETICPLGQSHTTDFEKTQKSSRNHETYR